MLNVKIILGGLLLLFVWLAVFEFSETGYW